MVLTFDLPKLFFLFQLYWPKHFVLDFLIFFWVAGSLGLLSTGRNILTIYYVLGIRESGPIGRMAQTYFSPGLIPLMVKYCLTQNQNQNHIIYPYLYVVYSIIK